MHAPGPTAPVLPAQAEKGPLVGTHLGAGVPARGAEGMNRKAPRNSVAIATRSGLGMRSPFARPWCAEALVRQHASTDGRANARPVAGVPRAVRCWRSAVRTFAMSG